MEIPGGKPTDVNDQTFVFLRSLAINCDLDLSVMTKLLKLRTEKGKKTCAT